MHRTILPTLIGFACLAGCHGETSRSTEVTPSASPRLETDLVICRELIIHHRDSPVPAIHAKVEQGAARLTLNSGEDPDGRRIELLVAPGLSEIRVFDELGQQVGLENL